MAVDRYRRGGNAFSKYLFFLIFLAIIAGGGFLYFSPMFEKVPPKIVFEKAYWNLKDDLEFKLEDSSGIKYYKVSLKTDKQEIELDKQILTNSSKSLTIKVKPPKLDRFFKSENTKIVIEAIDNSKWNFLEGNSNIKEFDIVIDSKRPIANVILNTRTITQGGSGVVVVEVRDKNLKDAYILFNNKVKFELIPFYKEGYYATLFAWPIAMKEFKRVSLVAVDKANNITKTKVPVYIKYTKPKQDKIKISDSFIEDVDTVVLEQSNKEVPADLKERFIAVNKNLRDENVKFIRNKVLERMDKNMVDVYKIRPFKRLRGSKEVASFGEIRHYYYKGNKIDVAWHLGIDWASVQKATVKVSNEGRVIFNDYLGIYGNTIIIDHGLGLSSLYAHTSSTDVILGEDVSRGTKIANTGSTGAVFGDHLHFGILIQGIEANPKEWMDKFWIKTRITDILNKAKQYISQKNR